ncbi:hypothetical protein BDP55DRAFT_757551 [Colletotrichum godetiae]|uniref:Uncharacterized protein n=1 Tax=Colletotrichum godetiae TaxID=1209918 RepID=A0AAJ0A911_9PEZI|nr:uncharacterized protein BDP55DRAFT_757551 [Colletotrichum godetiae]KAK1658745.1 hypothetical protein BDP55DRAFT_757551 [Colletotrichum godetiae]
MVRKVEPPRRDIPKMESSILQRSEGCEYSIPLYHTLAGKLGAGMGEIEESVEQYEWGRIFERQFSRIESTGSWLLLGSLTDPVRMIGGRLAHSSACSVSPESVSPRIRHFHYALCQDQHEAAAASKLGGFKSLSRRRQWHHSLRDGGSARKIQYLVVGAVTGGASLLCWQAYNGSSGAFRPKAVNSGFSLPRTSIKVNADGTTTVYKLDANEPYSEIRGASRSSIVEQAPKNGSSTSTLRREIQCTNCEKLLIWPRSMQNCLQDHPDEYDSELSKGRDDDLSVVKEEPGQAEKKFNC